MNIFYVFFYNVTSLSFFIRVVPATKDLLIIILFSGVMLFLLISRKVHLKKYLVPVYLVLILYLSWMVISSIFSGAPLDYKVLNLRYLTSFIIAFVAFLHLPLKSNSLNYIKSVLSFVTFSIVFFGLFEYFSPDYFWDDIIGLKKYAANRMLASTEVSRSYSSDLMFIVGRKVRRMLSFFAEPVTLGAYFTFIFSFIMFSKENWKYRKILLCLIFICGILVISKLFVVSVFVVLGYRYIFRKPVFYPLVGFSVFLFFVAGHLYEVFGKLHGSFAHLFGYYTGFVLLGDNPFGFGVGMAGNRGFLDHRIGMGEFGGESGLGNVLAQLGYPGLLFFIFIVILMYLCAREYKLTSNKEYIGIFVALFTYVINFYLSAASLGFTGNVMVFIFAGLYLNPNIIKLNREGYVKTI